MRWATFSTADKAEELITKLGLDAAVRVALHKIEAHGSGPGYQYWTDVLMLIRIKGGSDGKETIIEW